MLDDLNDKHGTVALAQAVAAAVPETKHGTLARALHTHGPLVHAQFVATRDGSWLDKRQVRTAAGDLVHDDHRMWLAEQLATDGGRAPATARRLAALDLRLTECAATLLYFTSDAGGPQECFVQATVQLQEEVLDRRLFDPAGWWPEPEDVLDLRRAAEDGPRLLQGERRPARPPSYRLVRVVDMAAFLAACETVHRGRLARDRARTVTLTELDGRQRRMSGAELDPDGDRYACRERRMVDDWTLSSAGRSGARLCEHWSFQTADHVDARGERWVSFVPLWTTRRRLAEVARMPRSDYELYGKLEAMDQRLGVPFGWFFFMLHGNRVHDWAGRRVLEAAEAGRIVLPEHDWRVLRRWAERPYGF